jgi:hypothetical protein
MADEKKDDDSLEPDELDEVSGGAIDSYIKIDDATDSFIKGDTPHSP